MSITGYEFLRTDEDSLEGQLTVLSKIQPFGAEHGGDIVNDAGHKNQCGMLAS